jgi:glycosyltransferase involved in cell wall biosynthesis
MNILHVVPRFPPIKKAGGASRVCYEYAKELSIRGHEVGVFTTDNYSRSSRTRSKVNSSLSGVEVRRFKNISNNMANRGYPIPPSMAVALIRNVKQYDLVHLHANRTVDVLFTYIACQLNQTPYIISPHGSVPRENKKFLKTTIDKLYNRRVFQKSDAIHAVSKFESSYFKDIFPCLDNNKLFHIPNGVDTNKYSPRPSLKNEFRKKYNIGEDKLVVLFLGRISKTKRPSVLLNSFKNCVKSRDDLILVYVGPDQGSQRELEVRAKNMGIDKKVIFAGPLYGEEKIESYVDSNIYVLPSEYDAFPISVIEALSCGLPSIISESTGITEYSTGGPIQTFSEPPQLEQEIMSLINNDKYRRQLSTEATNLARQKFDWSQIINQVEIMYEEVIRSH